MDVKGCELDATILVVDDHADNVRLVTRILHRAGYTAVSAVTDPRLAAERVKTLQPELVLVDLHMPHLDGYGVIEEIRPLLPDGVPILLVTGELDDDIRDDAVARGATDVVTKPFDLHRFVEAVGRQLSVWRASSTERRRAP